MGGGTCLLRKWKSKRNSYFHLLRPVYNPPKIFLSLSSKIFPHLTSPCPSTTPSLHLCTSSVTSPSPLFTSKYVRNTLLTILSPLILTAYLNTFRYTLFTPFNSFLHLSLISEFLTQPLLTPHLFLKHTISNTKFSSLLHLMTFHSNIILLVTSLFHTTPPSILTFS